MAVAEDVRFDHAGLADDALGRIAAAINRRFDSLDDDVPEDLAPGFSARPEVLTAQTEAPCGTPVSLRESALGWACSAPEKISGLELRNHKIIQDAPEGDATAGPENARHLMRAHIAVAQFSAALICYVAQNLYRDIFANVFGRIDRVVVLLDGLVDLAREFFVGADFGPEIGSP